MEKELTKKIGRLKMELNAVILAHTYQEPEIQELGDFVGDSLGLCTEASKTEAEVIVFCGVHFMAESAKLLNPDKLVLLPDTGAGCPMADMARAEDLRAIEGKHEGAAVVTYVNSSAAVKAESDICCTSSNAVKIVESVSKEREIIFVPDQNLGLYVMQQTGRELFLWPGYCPVHHLKVTTADIVEKKDAYPDAEVVVHPECPPEITGLADFVGSTSQIIQYCGSSKADSFIVGTEKGILYPLQKRNPGKAFVAASERMVCDDMKKITLEKIAACMEERSGEVKISPEIREKAYKAIKRMIELS